MTYTYEYERPAVTVDAVVFAVAPGTIEVLLIRREREPFEDHWALPGGFLDMDDDSADEAAARELQEETSIGGLRLEQFHAFSKRGRDPRGRTVSIAYYAVVPRGSLGAKAGDDAKDVAWFALDALPPLAFDHQEVIARSLARLRTPSSLLAKFDEAEYRRVCASKFDCEERFGDER